MDKVTNQKVKYTNRVFNKLSEIEKTNFINEFKYWFLEIGLTREELLRKMSLNRLLFTYICKEYNIVKTNEQLQKFRKQHTLEKYGVEHTSQLDSSKIKGKQTRLERYGDENYRNDEKIKQTCLKKYGVDNPWKSKDVHDKIQQTMINKYGYSTPLVDKEKMKAANLKKHGNANYNNREKAKQTLLNNPEIMKKHIEHMRQTNLKKYGTENVYASEVIKERIMKTNLEKYGVPWYCMTKECRELNGHTISQVNQRFAEILSKYKLIYEQEFSINRSSFDFKIGNILIELNPTYTHNSTNPYHHKNSKPKDITYHLQRSLLAQENGFRCIHIWDWDDIDKVVNLLLPKQKLYARKLELRDVSKKECDEFLNNYHLQNTCRGQIVCYGLYENDELIQLMTFGKPRYNKNYEWELLRLCTHKDYKVVGGSERLWKHFLRQQNPTNVISYCDNSKFSGEVYERLGMTLKEAQQPSCNWSNKKHRITQNLLNQRGFDQLFDTTYGKGTSNKELMIKHGYLEVYDCGQNVWIYNTLK